MRCHPAGPTPFSWIRGMPFTGAWLSTCLQPSPAQPSPNVVITYRFIALIISQVTGERPWRRGQGGRDQRVLFTQPPNFPSSLCNHITRSLFPRHFAGREPLCGAGASGHLFHSRRHFTESRPDLSGYAGGLSFSFILLLPAAAPTQAPLPEHHRAVASAH